MSLSVLEKILEHPDREEIISKMLMNIPCQDIHEYLEAKYSEISEKKLVISKKSLEMFQKNNLQMYQIIKNDISEKYNKSSNNRTELQTVLNGNEIYNKKLNEHLDTEIDIKKMMVRLLSACEHRLAQLFELVQSDVENVKMDQVLINWFNSLMMLMEKLNTINNSAPEQNINIQNNISIQVVDQQIHVVLDVIKNILTKLDYDTSLVFMELFNEEMSKIKEPEKLQIIPVNERLETISSLNNTISVKLEQ